MPVEAVVAIAGLIASFLSGLLGIGGGIVLTPVLLYAPQLVGAPALSVKIITGLTVVGSTLYFVADDGTAGLELWKSDGTSAGTVLVRELVSGPGGASIGAMAALGNLLVFVADDRNHRVLRFPKQGTSIAKTADLVIGQINFTSNTSGTQVIPRRPATSRVSRWRSSGAGAA